jgi:hypothetical protein
LREHYEDVGRPETTRNLVAAIESTWRQINTNPAGGLTAPRPSLAIVAVVYDAADIPRRV